MASNNYRKGWKGESRSLFLLSRGRRQGNPLIKYMVGSDEYVILQELTGNKSWFRGRVHFAFLGNQSLNNTFLPHNRKKIHLCTKLWSKKLILQKQNHLTWRLKKGSVSILSSLYKKILIVCIFAYFWTEGSIHIPFQ